MTYFNTTELMEDRLNGIIMKYTTLNLMKELL